MFRNRSNTFPRFAVSAALVCITAVMNVVSTQAVSARQLQQGTILADSGFQMNRDNFKFQNYYSANLPYDNLTSVGMVRMFGNNICNSDVDTNGGCTLIPTAQAWMDNISQEMNGGHCGGMAILSELFYTKQEKLSDFNASETDAIPFSTPIQHEIAYWWATNGLPSKVTVRGTPNEVTDALVQKLQDNKETYSLEVWKAPNSPEGHAVNPYQVLDMGDGTYQIVVYDNNYPDQPGKIIVDRNANTWSYNLSVNPGVEPNVWSGDATSQTMFLAANSPRFGVQVAPFDTSSATSQGESGNQLVAFYPQQQQAQIEYNEISLDSSDPKQAASLLITDDKGRRLGQIGDKTYTEIPDAKILQLPADGAAGNEIGPDYLIPSGTKFSVAIDGSSLKAATVHNLWLVGPDYDISIENINLPPGASDSASFAADGSNMTYTSSNTAAPDVTFGVVHSGADYEITLTGVDIEKSGTINASLNYDKGQFALSTVGNQSPITYDMLVNRYDQKQTFTFEHHNLELDPTATIYADFGKWDGKGDMSLGIDQNSDGTIEKVQPEGNQKQ